MEVGVRSMLYRSKCLVASRNTFFVAYFILIFTRSVLLHVWIINISSFLSRAHSWSSVILQVIMADFSLERAMACCYFAFAVRAAAYYSALVALHLQYRIRCWYCCHTFLVCRHCWSVVSVFFILGTAICGACMLGPVVPLDQNFVAPVRNVLKGPGRRDIKHPKAETELCYVSTFIGKDDTSRAFQSIHTGEKQNK